MKGTKKLFSCPVLEGKHELYEIYRVGEGFTYIIMLEVTPKLIDRAITLTEEGAVNSFQLLPDKVVLEMELGTFHIEIE